MCHRFAWSRLVLGTRLRRADASALTVCGTLAAAWNAARTARAASLAARAALIAAVATSPIAVVAAVATLAAAAAAAVAASTFAAAHAAAAVATLAASRKHASHRPSERVCALGLLWSLNCSGDRREPLGLHAERPATRGESVEGKGAAGEPRFGD